MRPARCDRSREAISLRLDGAVSTFEAVLLDRHLRRCGECRSFADALAVQTGLLRDAELEEPSRHVVIPAPRRPLRRVAGGLLTAAAAAAAAAVLTVSSGGQHAQTSATSASEGAQTGGFVLVTVPAHPSPGMKETVPRLTVLPAAVADGPVHGLFSTPVRM